MDHGHSQYSTVFLGLSSLLLRPTSHSLPLSSRERQRDLSDPFLHWLGDEVFVRSRLEIFRVDLRWSLLSLRGETDSVVVTRQCDAHSVNDEHVIYLACSWNIGLGHQRMFGRSPEYCGHLHYYHSCSTPEKSSDEPTFGLASKSPPNHSARCCFRSLHVRLVTVCHLFRHYSIYACAFSLVALFNVSQLLSIRLESSLSLRLSSGFTSSEESSEKLHTSEINTSAASRPTDGID